MEATTPKREWWSEQHWAALQEIVPRHELQYGGVDWTAVKEEWEAQTGTVRSTNSMKLKWGKHHRAQSKAKVEAEPSVAALTDLEPQLWARSMVSCGPLRHSHSLMAPPEVWDAHSSPASLPHLLNPPITHSAPNGAWVGPRRTAVPGFWRSLTSLGSRRLCVW